MTTPQTHQAATQLRSTQPNPLERFAPLRFSVIFAIVIAGALSACGGGGSEQAIVASAAPISTLAPVGAVPIVPTAPGSGSAPPACAKTNAKVGQVATLSNRAHGVSGMVVVVDNCTLEIRNFNYDGGGLSKVFVYGGKAGNYAAGFPVGNNLRGTSFANQTLTVNLSPGDLDRMDGVSIWCADANANFGDGTFAPAAPL